MVNNFSDILRQVLLQSEQQQHCRHLTQVPCSVIIMRCVRTLGTVAEAEALPFHAVVTDERYSYHATRRRQLNR